VELVEVCLCPIKREEKVSRAPSETPFFKTGVLRRGSGTL
jgi:hypothetical protein